MTKLQDPCINEELLSKFDVPGPRYTSYPTADRFNNGFGEQDWLNALTIRGENIGLVGEPLARGPCQFTFIFRFVSRYVITVPVIKLLLKSAISQLNI